MLRISGGRGGELAHRSGNPLHPLVRGRAASLNKRRVIRSTVRGTRSVTRTPISPVWPIRWLESCLRKKLAGFIKTAKSGAKICYQFHQYSYLFANGLMLPESK